MSCGVDCRLGLDPVLLWLWCRLAAIAPIRPLAGEPPYAEGVALKRQGKKKVTLKKKKYMELLPLSFLYPLFLQWVCLYFHWDVILAFLVDFYRYILYSTLLIFVWFGLVWFF